MGGSSELSTRAAQTAALTATLADEHVHRVWESASCSTRNEMIYELVFDRVLDMLSITCASGGSPS